MKISERKPFPEPFADLDHDMALSRDRGAGPQPAPALGLRTLARLRCAAIASCSNPDYRSLNGKKTLRNVLFYDTRKSTEFAISMLELTFKQLEELEQQRARER